MPDLSTIGLLINERNPAALAAARHLVEHLYSTYGREGPIRILAHEAVSERIGLEPGSQDFCCPSDDSVIAKASDFAVVFGGDGTLLAAARLLAPHSVPILGIHLGHFGFINEAPPERMTEAVEDVLAGRSTVEERMMLRGVVERASTDGENDSAAPTQELLAMNDIVLASGAVRMVHVRVDIGGQTLATYPADGVIVSSPTGSTGYSLSAGGPLVHPAAPVLLITPICAHTLNARALVVPATETIRMTVEGRTRDAVVANVDGQLDIPLVANDSVTVTRAPYSVRLLSVGGPDFYGKIRSRWHFGARETA